jgi:hypothetical protein
LQISAACSRPLQYADMFHMRGLTCQWYLKLYYVGLCWRFCKFSPCFHLCGLWRFDLNSHNLSRSFPTFWLIKPLKIVFSPWHSHQKLFWPFHVFLIPVSQVWRFLSTFINWFAWYISVNENFSKTCAF